MAPGGARLGVQDVYAATDAAERDDGRLCCAHRQVSTLLPSAGNCQKLPSHVPAVLGKALLAVARHSTACLARSAPPLHAISRAMDQVQSEHRFLHTTAERTSAARPAPPQDAPHLLPPQLQRQCAKSHPA